MASKQVSQDSVYAVQEDALKRATYSEAPRVVQLLEKISSGPETHHIIME